MRRLAFLSRLFHSSPPSDRASVAVYQRGDRLLVTVDDQTEAGFWVATDRITTLPVPIDAAELGAAVHAALTTSRTGVPTPSFRGAPPLDEPLWRAAGVRSRRAFMTGTRLCSIARDGGTLTVSATVNGGTSGDARGWRPSDAPPRTLPAAAAAAAATLGAAVRAALEESLPWPLVPDTLR